MKANSFKVEDGKVYLNGSRIHGVTNYVVWEPAEGFPKVNIEIGVDSVETEVEDPEVTTDFDLALPKLVQVALLQTLQEKLEDEPTETS